MNGLLKTKKINIYEKSLEEDIKKLKEIPYAYNEIQFFIDVVAKHQLYDNISIKKPKIILIGTNIPEEIVYASGITPYWIIGGNLATIGWSDSFVPRDTDSVSRALLGEILNDDFEVAKNALIIVPFINDSFKKITYLLKRENYKVHFIFVPSTKNKDYVD